MDRRRNKNREFKNIANRIKNEQIVFEPEEFLMIMQGREP